jgi:hypothetical protein
MSLCYDFQKWTMLSLALVAVSLTVGLLLQVVYGYVDGNGNGKEDLQRDLVDTGKISEGKLLLIPKSCDDAKDTKQDMENLKNTLNDAFTLDKMDN